MNGFRVLEPGVLSLFQDAGRLGYHALGMTAGGPMDGTAFYWANRLVGNPEGATTLEVAQGGLRLECTGDTSVAVAGAAMPLKINGQTKALWRSHRVTPGDVLELGHATAGLRTYVAAAAGFEAPVYFGSTAVVRREGLGKPLHAGQELVCGASTDTDWALPMDQIPRCEATVTLRVVEGYQVSEFSAGSRELFYRSAFQVSPRSDRMGYRLEGNAVAAPAGERFSEGIGYGAVQVPPDGQPIVLLNDRQTIGGYPKLGTVLSLDCWKLAQCAPGAKVCFEVISLEAAQAAVEEATATREATALKCSA